MAKKAPLQKESNKKSSRPGPPNLKLLRFPKKEGETSRSQNIDITTFRAFQSNLISLISHELRTPLTGILNSLSLLADRQTPDGFNPEELVEMARRNALKLNQALATLLDLAALEAGSFQVRLKEINLERLVRLRARELQPWVREQQVQLVIENKIETKNPENLPPLLADVQKLGRAVDLAICLLCSHSHKDHAIKIFLFGNGLEIHADVPSQEAQILSRHWENFRESKGKNSVDSLHAFSGTLQSTEAFLSRTREGLGSELYLIDEILRNHSGRFDLKIEEGKVILKLMLSLLSSKDRLKAVLLSRVYEASTGLNSVALCLIQLPRGFELKEFQEKLTRCLYRSSDAVYALEKEKQLALVMNDCKAGDAPGLLKRIERAMKLDLDYGIVACPEEGTDPEALLTLAESRLEGLRGDAVD